MSKAKKGGPSKYNAYNKNPWHVPKTIKVALGVAILGCGYGVYANHFQGEEPEQNRPGVEATREPSDAPKAPKPKKTKQPSTKPERGDESRTDGRFQSDLRGVMGKNYMGNEPTHRVNAASDPRGMVDAAVDAVAGRPDLDVTPADVACTMAGHPGNAKIVEKALESGEGVAQAERALSTFGRNSKIAAAACSQVVIIGVESIAAAKDGWLLIPNP